MIMEWKSSVVTKGLVRLHRVLTDAKYLYFDTAAVASVKEAPVHRP